MKINILGIDVDNLTTSEAVEKIRNFVLSGQPHYGVTPYSEFIVEAQKNGQFKAAINKADISLPDGIGILWAARFLSLPKTNQITTFFNWFGTLASIVLAPESIRTVIKEKITGSRFVWNIAELAEKNNFSIALVGGWNGVAEKAASKLREKHPNLKINLAYCPPAFDQAAIDKISQSNSDILLLAYQPPKQEIWLSENISKLNVKFAIGLGGTFDYLAGVFPIAPKFFSTFGLEWLWRLITQPKRFKRIWNATVNFSILVLNFKLNE